MRVRRLRSGTWALVRLRRWHRWHRWWGHPVWALSGPRDGRFRCSGCQRTFGAHPGWHLVTGRMIERQAGGW